MRMHGAILLPSFLAGFVFPGARQCFALTAPFLAIAGLLFLVNRTDRIISHFYPDREWEHSLGWLNIKAERRANTALRWVGYGIYILLLDALVGILWAAEGLQHLDNWSDPWVMGDLALRVPALMICLGIWVLYLGGWLLPKWRAEREAALWKKMRAEAKEFEQDREPQSHSRIHAPLRKPRTNAPLMTSMPKRMGRRREPGG
jgi:hypothetical protein